MNDWWFGDRQMVKSSFDKRTFLKATLKYLVILLGSAIYAFGFQYFMYPNAIVSGGINVFGNGFESISEVN